MSRETIEWLNTNILRGFTDKRGHAWHYTASAQGVEPNHYPDAIPVEDLYRRLFGWEAQARALYSEDALGQKTIVPGHVAWCRSDTGAVLGIHSDGYKGHQYAEWCVKSVETVLDSGLSIASAGLLSGGAVAWVQVEMPENVETPEGVTFRPFLMATTSFDGSIANTMQRGFTDVVCDNTRAQFLAERGETYRVKHTRHSALDITKARSDLGVLYGMADAFSQDIARLCAIDITDAEWSRFVEAHVPIKDETSKRSVTMSTKVREGLAKMWNTDTRVTPWRGTAWGAIQAVNTYAHHESIVRNVGRVERNMMRVVEGKAAEGDRTAVATLASVLPEGKRLALMTPPVDRGRILVAV